jgi:thiamine biosynthesis lipoprotein
VVGLVRHVARPAGAQRRELIVADAQLALRVMGTTAHVIVVADSVDAAGDGVEYARARLEQLERRWSRFRPDSEIARLNAAAGTPVVVHPDTLRLVEHAVDGWHRTDGRFDPTVLDAVVALGYDRDFDAIDRAAPHPVTVTIPAPGCAGIVTDRVVGAVRLPPGVHVDPGGIGKGLAADLVVDALMRAGARGVLVNVGGDLRVEGDAPDRDGWCVAIDHPHTGATLTETRLDGGAVASTWSTRRTWGGPGGERHHLVDPATGTCATSGLAGVTVLAARAWWAEVLAKAAFVAGPVAGPELLARHGVTGWCTDDTGAVHPVGAVTAFAA